jgi:hypothetical protein
LDPRASRGDMRTNTGGRPGAVAGIPEKIERT